MRALVFYMFLVSCLVKDSSMIIRKHYIAAVEFNWDYRSSNLLSRLGIGDVRQKITTSTFPQYRKAVFMEFKDSSFLIPEAKPPWMGILGPTIRAEINDKVVIHFKNLASRPYSIHPFGISYWKMSEGASYNDRTSTYEKKDDFVAPSEEYIYIWDINWNLGPMNDDANCLTYAYSSRVDPVRDFNSGLVGAVLVCKQGTLNQLGKQINRQEFVLLFSTIDESKSMYLETDSIKYRISGTQKNKGLMYTINGYINGSLPDLNICKNKYVSWHLLAMGSTPDQYSIYFGGYGLLLHDHRVVSVELAPTAFATAEMSPNYENKWLLGCQNPNHQQAGMTAYFNIEGICKDDSASSQKMTESEKAEDYFNNETYDDEEDNEQVFKMTIKYMLRTTVTKSRSMEWIYFIAAEECDWDYAPTIPSDTSRTLREKYLERGPHRIGKKYKKAVYVQYTDHTFRVVKHKPDAHSSKGILGPVLRAEVGDRFKDDLKQGVSTLLCFCSNIDKNGMRRVLNATTMIDWNMHAHKRGSQTYSTSHLEGCPDPTGESVVAAGDTSFKKFTFPITIEIVFRNLASRTYNIIPHGLTKLKMDGAGDINVRNHAVKPNETVTYFWTVAQSDGPTGSDLGCLTRFYYSNVDMDRDIASGLLGPLLICAKNTIDSYARPVKIDKTKYLYFSLFDENKSWYINENVEKYCEDPSQVDPDDPEFYASNLMYSINGFVFENVPKLEFCKNELIFWHVILGAQEKFLSIYFHGQTFKYDGVYADVLTLFPFSSETIHMDMDNIGFWDLEPLNHHYQIQGMRAKYNVRYCDNDSDNLEDSLIEINSKEDDPDLARGSILRDEIRSPFAAPRGIKGYSNNLTDFYEAIDMEEKINVTDDEENTAGIDPVWSHCKQWQYPDLGEQLRKVKKDIQLLNDGIDKRISKQNNDLNRTVKKDFYGPPKTGKDPNIIESEKIYNNSLFYKLSRVNNEDIDESVKAKFSSNSFTQSNRIRERTHHDLLKSNLTSAGVISKIKLLFANQTHEMEDALSNKLKTNESQKLLDTTDTNPLKTSKIEPVFSNETEQMKFLENETEVEFMESSDVRLNQTLLDKNSNTAAKFILAEDTFDYDDYEEATYSGEGDKSNYNDMHDINIRKFSNRELCLEEERRHVLRTFSSQSRYYYIAAVETVWDYEGDKTDGASEYSWKQKSQRRILGSKFKKVVFIQYKDSMFKQPVIRGEKEKHLGILGPVISAEVNDIIVVKFKNMASRPFSIHAHGVSRELPNEDIFEEKMSKDWPRKEEDIVNPNETKNYIWHVTKGSAPTDKDFDCKAWSYYSDVNPERDIHTGLIGPLIICKTGTLHKITYGISKVQEFSLLFMTFDETKSWFLEDNIHTFCSSPCYVKQESTVFQSSMKFHAINGHVAETLPGLVMAQNQLVRWYLLSVDGSADIYSVHFHGQPFIMRRAKMHRMGVYTLLPGLFGTIEMNPTKVGYWLLDCETAEHLQKGMRAIFLVYDSRGTIQWGMQHLWKEKQLKFQLQVPSCSIDGHGPEMITVSVSTDDAQPECKEPLGLQDGRVADRQLTASDHIGNWAPQLARLRNSARINAWRAKGRRPWIQVDLKKTMLIHGIISQGARHIFRHYFVDHFYISYSLDTHTWKNYKSNTSLDIQIFKGNIDGTGQVKNYFIPPIVAQYVRVYPKPNGGPLALRMELLSCDLQSCSLPLGMENGIIEDHQLSASSFWVGLSAWTPYLARLNQGGFTNAWVPKRNNPHEWLQINFLQRKRITGIITQGASYLKQPMFVKEYIVSYSDNRKSWTVIKDSYSLENKIFKGNVDNDGHVQNTFDYPIFAQFLRIIPQTWQKNIALRIEILGCNTEQRF